LGGIFTFLAKTDEKSLLFSEISTQKVKMANQAFDAYSLLRRILHDPGEELLATHGSGRHGKAHPGHLLVGGVDMDAVDLKEAQHHIHADALVSIHKGMV
jgi:hypothetical protein